MTRLGFIINPVAGIGGKVGLKGSDGVDTQRKAIQLGAKPESGKKAEIALRTAVEQLSGETLPEIHTCPGVMGEDIVKKFPFPCHVIKVGSAGSGRGSADSLGTNDSDPATADLAGSLGADLSTTTAADTVTAARALKEAGVDLILFAGGDGTARNVLDAVGTEIPVLGIPAGCKIHSSVYAINPKSAGELIATFSAGGVKETREAEVMDIDEALFRENRVDARLYGYLRVPEAGRRVQNLKSGRGLSESGSLAFLSRYIADQIEADTLYIVATGSTTKHIMDAIGLPGTLLGVDLICNGEVVKNDAAEQDILAALRACPRAKIIVTVIGGQGYLFGRGNQQISGDVIRKVGRENIIIAATKDKMLSLLGRSLLVDTGDEEVNAMLKGYFKITVGYEEYVVFKVSD